MLLPVNTHAESLEATVPLHTARYSFRYPDIGAVRLDVEMKKTSGTDFYEVLRKQWTRNPGEGDLSAQRPLLELFTVRLQEY